MVVQDALTRLSKDKKSSDDAAKATQAALSAEEDKVNTLNKLKAKLEQSLDQAGRLSYAFSF